MGEKEQPLSSKDTSKAAGAFFKSYFVLLFLAVLFGSQDLSSPTRSGTCALSSESS